MRGAGQALSHAWWRLTLPPGFREAGQGPGGTPSSGTAAAGPLGNRGLRGGRAGRPESGTAPWRGVSGQARPLGGRGRGGGVLAGGVAHSSGGPPASARRSPHTGRRCSSQVSMAGRLGMCPSSWWPSAKHSPTARRSLLQLTHTAEAGAPCTLRVQGRHSRGGRSGSGLLARPGRPQQLEREKRTRST